jgi:hypothetical protein
LVGYLVVGMIDRGSRWGEVGFVAAVAPSYRRFRYSVKVISHCVWLYHRFPLSFREARR